MRESSLVAGRKDRQIVVRVPERLYAAIEEHRRELQAARPFENITAAAATHSSRGRRMWQSM